MRQIYLIYYFESIFRGHCHIENSPQDYSTLDFMAAKYDELSKETKVLLISYAAALCYHDGDYDGAIERFDYFIHFLHSHKDICMEEPCIKETCCMFYCLIDVLQQKLHNFTKDNSITARDKKKMSEIRDMLVQELKDPVNNKQRAAAQLCIMEMEYVLGEIPLHKLLSKINQAAKNDSSTFYADHDTYHFLYATRYINYLNCFSSLSEKRKVKQCEIVMKHVLDVYRRMTKTVDAYYTTRYCADLILAASECMGFERIKDYVLALTIYADKALYLHTMMVKNIGNVILNEILCTDPFYLEGLCGKEGEYIASHPLEILNIWQECAMFHDIGKHCCIDYVSNSSRSLTDQEFQAIKDHPANFDLFFQKSTGPLFDCIRACARNHHVWYNEKGGYPQPVPTADKKMVDILSIADSIDAATDVIGRPYTAGKSLDSLIEEFDTFRNTRYSAYVIDVLKKTHVKTKIEELIHVERKHLNYMVYSGQVQ